MTNAITWFEIPVGNLERATKFYESTLARGKPRRPACIAVTNAEGR
ncbi:MAG TPA: hypothetical protein VFR86_23880 [Burkholderiaceae bacterium]|nr:hypothetical protein [Burkholderiaceae bacterium]